MSCFMLAVQAVTPQSFYEQTCFAIDYDFATHRCYFFTVNVVQAFAITADTTVPPNTAVAPYPLLLHCITSSTAQQPGSLGLQPNPTVVHITLCEFQFIGKIHHIAVRAKHLEQLPCYKAD